MYSDGPLQSKFFWLLRSFRCAFLFIFAMIGKTGEIAVKTTRKSERAESWNDQKKPERLKKSERESHSLITGWKKDLSIMYRLYLADFLYVSALCVLRQDDSLRQEYWRIYEFVKRQKNLASALAHCSRNRPPNFLHRGQKRKYMEEKTTTKFSYR
jgi:hypothetical protein